MYVCVCVCVLGYGVGMKNIHHLKIADFVTENLKIVCTFGLFTMKNVHCLKEAQGANPLEVR